MLTVRKSSERGHANHGWLDSFHTFSFAGYRDPAWMGFGPLRVINDDTVAGGGGFPPHPHRDMEIVSYVIDGALAHRDDMGNGSVIARGDVQRMTAGRGVTHSEYNASKTEPVHFLQIWIVPERRGLSPGYEQKNWSDDDKRDRLRLVASPDGAEGSVRIHQDARMYASVLGAGASVAHVLEPGRKAWLQVVSGAVRLDELELEGGDGVAVEDEERIALTSSAGAELLLFDLPT